MTEVAYFDEPGRPTRHKDGYARFTAKYDERGNQIEEAYFDEHGRPTRHKDGYARLTAKYDERGNQIENRPTSTSTASPPGTRTATPGAPPSTTSGATWTEEAYFDEAGRPTRHKDGYARLTAQYDERGNQIENWPTSTRPASPPGTRTATPG